MQIFSVIRKPTNNSEAKVVTGRHRDAFMVVELPDTDDLLAEHTIDHHATWAAQAIIRQAFVEVERLRRERWEEWARGCDARAKERQRLAAEAEAAAWARAAEAARAEMERRLAAEMIAEQRLAKDSRDARRLDAENAVRSAGQRQASLNARRASE